MSVITIDGHRIDFGNADKILFPKEGITKQDIGDYYQEIAPFLLPYAKERPISMKRFPDGIGEQGFFQKEMPDYFPDWIARARVMVEHRNEYQDQVVINNAATLVFLADQANISIHTWMSRSDKLDYPDKVVFDLDPPDDNFEPIRQGALSVGNFVREVGLTPFAMTTGSRGLHVVIPIERELPFDDVKNFARQVAVFLARQHPAALTTEFSKKKRKGRLLIDYFRNAYAQTSVAPYTLRAKDGAPVAAPLEWDELKDTGLTSKKYTIENIFRRLGQKPDPWRDYFEKAGLIRQAGEKLKAITG